MTKRNFGRQNRVLRLTDEKQSRNRSTNGSSALVFKNHFYRNVRLKNAQNINTC